jgi:integrase
MRRIKSGLKRLGEHFSGKSVAAVTVSALIGYLEHRRLCLKTFNNQRGILGTFFKFAFHRGWVSENPILMIPNYRIRHRRTTARTFSAAQVGELMNYGETFDDGGWVPYFALCLFACIGPSIPDGEIARLKPEDVRLDAGMNHISAEVSKVRERRKIAIQPNLAAWMRAYPHPLPVDQAPAHPASPRRALRLLRSRRNLTPEPKE